jgi:hypothetical protein
VREDGSCGAYNGRNSRTRSLSTVIPRSQPTRSAITVAGMSGVSFSSSRIFCSTASTTEPVAARTYFGGTVDRTALRTVFLAMSSFFAIALIDIRSDKYKRRTSAHSCTVITLPDTGRVGVNIHPS